MATITELYTLYERQKALQPAFYEYMEISKRIRQLEHECQGRNEANQKFELDHKKERRAKKEPKQDNSVVALFRGLTPEQQAQIMGRLEVK